MDDPPGRRTLRDRARPLIPDGLDATIVLARHGESTFIVEGRFQGQADAPLTDTGRRQAALLGDRLARPHDVPALPVPASDPVELVHSPLARTSETASAVADATRLASGRDLPGRPDPGFLEIHQGEWQGLHRDEIQARYGDVLSTWRRTPLDAWAPGGESLPQVRDRVRPALTALLARLAQGQAPGALDRSQVAGYRDPQPVHPWSIVVGHDGVFKIVLLALFDLPLERFWMWSMDLCSITVVELRAGRPVLRAHNLTAHLAGLSDAEDVADLEERESSGAL